MHRDLDWAAEVERLRAADAFRDGLYRKVVAWLDPPPGATVLDAGCGAGGMTARLAEAVGPGGRVVALDAEPAAVAATGDLVAARGLAGRVAVTAGELPGAVAGHGPFDLIWASHVVHHLPDEATAVRALAGRLRPGGRLALAEGGLPMRCLPVDVGLGRPGLESRLEAAAARWFAGLRAGLAGSVPRPHGWPRLLAGAGLVGVGTRSFLLELGPPRRRVRPGRRQCPARHPTTSLIDRAPGHRQQFNSSVTFGTTGFLLASWRFRIFENAYRSRLVRGRAAEGGTCSCPG